MTLIVSLRTSDGIVLAGDSLSTMRTQLQVAGDFTMKCPQCGHKHTESQHIGAIGIPTSTMSYAQKVFPFMEKFGVGTFNAGQLAGKTMYFAMRELEQQLLEGKTRVGTASKAADRIGKHAQSLLKKDVSDLSNAPEDKFAVGFQVVGYDDDKPVTISVDVGKQIQKTKYEKLGCSISGVSNVVKAIWGLRDQTPQDKVEYAALSLQDAIDYAKFLIRTTASYQKFSRTIPTVGGEIDIALVTPFDGFSWIQRKDLNKVIDKRIN